jgi:hypothetical protein
MSPTKKYLRPPALLSNFINPLFVTLRVIPILSVVGRKSGKIIRTPIFPFIYNGETYLVAPRGETQWVRNLRVAKKGTIITFVKKRKFKVEEITGKFREEIVTAYRQKTKIAENEFAALPNPSDHPAFKVTFLNS